MNSVIVTGNPIRVKPLSWPVEKSKVDATRLSIRCTGAAMCGEERCPHYARHNRTDECAPGLCIATAELNRVQCGGR